MTILEAIIEVLSLEPAGLTCAEITQQILDRDLYHFNAANPGSIVNHDIRRRCVDLDFPSAHPVKYFRIVGGKRGHTKYQLLSKPISDVSDVPRKEASQERKTDLLPAEQMQQFALKHKTTILQELKDRVLNNDPAFFESLVVDLLLKLGYGYGVDSGKVVGKSHDGGIDGIIYEDKLGLDKIYIQAKKYSPSHKVVSKEVQAFLGAMGGTKKGVFITTSSFTNDARNAIERDSGKNVSLIDGETLFKLMIDYNVGVRVVKSFNVYEIDSDYFG